MWCGTVEVRRLESPQGEAKVLLNAYSVLTLFDTLPVTLASGGTSPSGEGGCSYLRMGDIFKNGGHRLWGRARSLFLSGLRQLAITPPTRETGISGKVVGEMTIFRQLR